MLLSHMQNYMFKIYTLNELFKILRFSWKTDIPENIRLRFSITKKSGDSKEKPNDRLKKKNTQRNFLKGKLLDIVNLQILIEIATNVKNITSHQ